MREGPIAVYRLRRPTGMNRRSDAMLRYDKPHDIDAVFFSAVSWVSVYNGPSTNLNYCVAVFMHIGVVTPNKCWMYRSQLVSTTPFFVYVR